MACGPVSAVTCWLEMLRVILCACVPLPRISKQNHPWTIAIEQVLIGEFGDTSESFSNFEFSLLRYALWRVRQDRGRPLRSLQKLIILVEFRVEMTRAVSEGLMLPPKPINSNIYVKLFFRYPLFCPSWQTV